MRSQGRTAQLLVGLVALTASVVPATGTAWAGTAETTVSASAAPPAQVAAAGRPVAPLPKATRATARRTLVKARPGTAPRPAPAEPSRPFPLSTAFWSPLPAAPPLDPASAAVSAALGQRGAGRVLNVEQYGQPIWEATATTPRYRLHVRQAGPWGDNDLRHTTVPIPAGAKPSPGTDGKLVVVDRAAGKVYDLWQAARTATGWSVSWGGVYDLAGDGAGRKVMYGRGPNTVAWPKPVSRGTGSGISSLAGVVRVSELAAGDIPHALVFSTNIPCGPANTGSFRYPATTTDGFVTKGTCIPQGARFQLDPSIDLAAIKGITKAELAIGRALQRYGAFCIDQGGARIALVAETPHDAKGREVYRAAGVSWDYFGLDRLPWGRVRVLAASTGTPPPAAALARAAGR